jgi:hypothetical protein
LIFSLGLLFIFEYDEQELRKKQRQKWLFTFERRSGNIIKQFSDLMWYIVAINQKLFFCVGLEITVKGDPVFKSAQMHKIT